MSYTHLTEKERYVISHLKIAHFPRDTEGDADQFVEFLTKTRSVQCQVLNYKV